LPDVPLSSYLPASSYATARPATAYAPPASIVNFHKGALPAGAPMDWQNIITSNPGYMQWELGAAEQADTAAANRKAAMRALAIRFGGLPENFSDVYGDIDPETARLAAANPESESNRLLRSYTQQTEQARRQLAARGMLQSGELGYGQEQLDLQRQSNVYDLNNQFLEASSGTLGDYGKMIAGLNADQITQLQSAADRIAQERLYQAQIDAMNAAAQGGGGYDGGGGGTDGGGQQSFDPSTVNWGAYSWGGDTMRQTYQALRQIYDPVKARQMAYNWMNNYRNNQGVGGWGARDVGAGAYSPTLPANYAAPTWEQWNQYMGGW
jgi:hypothetical protein